jgi:hypothetical protein
VELQYEGVANSTAIPRSRPSAPVAIGAGIGVAITIPSMVLAVFSTGAGHGDYGFARGLFPIAMCLTAFVTGSIGFASIALALLQFPLYGSGIGYFATVSRKALLIAIAIVAVLHFIAFIACSSSSSMFS